MNEEQRRKTDKKLGKIIQTSTKRKHYNNHKHHRHIERENARNAPRMESETSGERKHIYGKNRNEDEIRDTKCETSERTEE